MTQTISTREAGKQIFEAQIKAAGLRCVESSKIRTGHYRICRWLNGEICESCEVKLTTSIHEAFSLYEKDRDFSLIVYVWNAQTRDQSSIYALTFDEAHQIMESKGFTNTPAWGKGGYSITHSGSELKDLLRNFRMTPETWQTRLKELSE